MNEQTVTIDAPSFRPPAPPAGPPPRSYQLPVARNPADHKLGGVIGGLSRTYGFDVRTTRIAVAISTLVLPIIALAYVALWVLLPKRPEEAMSFEAIIRDRWRVPLYVAIGLVLVAGGLGSFGSWFFLGGFSWGVGLIAIGVLLWVAPGLMRANNEADRASGAAAMPRPPAPSDSPAPGSFVAPSSSVAGSWPTDSRADPTTATPWTAARPLQMGEIRPHRRRRPVASIAALAVLAFIGIARAGDALDWWDIPVLTTLVVSLFAVAVGSIVSAIVNRSWLSLPLVAIITPITVGLLITQPDLDGGLGERRFTAHTIADAEQNRQLGLGEMTVDLTNLPMAAIDEAIDVRAEVGIGHLVVIVPDDVTLTIDAELGAGDVMVDGFNVGDGLRDHITRVVDSDGVSTGTINLDVSVGMGRIDVQRTV